jgi:hypothetical protein
LLAAGIPTDQPKRQEESMSISVSSHQQVRYRAYEIFQERRNTGRKGDASSDWLEAEQEIRRRHMPVPARMLHRHFPAAALPLNLFWPQTTLAPPRPHPQSVRRSA